MIYECILSFGFNSLKDTENKEVYEQPIRVL